ncbi:MAG: hypothetical protein LBD85_02110, partial [Oscillospiraceae bacterium]|nr:hypothetical protein [Oscillospiraceae bacterium]
MTLTNEYLEVIPAVASYAGTGSYIQNTYLFLTSHNYDLQVVSTNPQYNVIELPIRPNDAIITAGGTAQGSCFMYYFATYRGYYHMSFSGLYTTTTNKTQPLTHTINSEQTIKVTKGVDIGVYRKVGRHFTPFMKY